MSIQKRDEGNTWVTQSFPWGLYLPNGHRLLCSDGVIRAAKLAQTADTFFSVPAYIRFNGRSISGYMSAEENDNGQKVFSFRQHTNQSNPHTLPAWPPQFSAEHNKLVADTHVTIAEVYERDPRQGCKLAIAATRHLQECNRMDAINKLLSLHGVEAIRGAWQNGYWQDIVASYCNAGDTDAITVIHQRGENQYRAGKFVIASMGDFVERNSSRLSIA